MAASGSNKIRNAKLSRFLLGDVRAGKSSLVFRFVKGQFVEFQESTIGAAFFSQALVVNDGTVKFEIWDTAGQQRNHLLEKKKWVQELQAQGKLCFYAGSVNKEDVDCILYLKTCQALNPGP